MNTILQNRIEEAVETLINYNLVDLGDLVNQYDLRRMLIEIGVKTLQNQWISVEEALPPLDDGMESISIEVVVKNEYGKATCAWYSYVTNTWHLSYGEIAGDDLIDSKITHWMEIPKN